MITNIDTLLVCSDHPIKEAIEIIFKKLTEFGVSAEVDHGLYYLRDYEGSDFEPQPIIDPQNAMDKLLHWPAGGFIEMRVNGASFLLSIYSINSGQISAIGISWQKGISATLNILNSYILDTFFKLEFCIRLIQEEDIFDELDIEKFSIAVRNGILEGEFSVDKVK